MEERMSSRTLTIAGLGLLVFWHPASGPIATAGAQPAGAEPGTVEGTDYDAFYGEYQWRDDVVAGNRGKGVVLRDVDTGVSVEAALEGSGAYRTKAPPGTYEIQFLNERWILPYRRARFRVHGGTLAGINLYSIPHAGTALTAHGDRALPDPELSYDEYHPDEKTPDLNLLVQYHARREHWATVEYQGPYLMLTFDTLTLRARTLLMERGTLKVTASQDVFVDLNGNRRRVAHAELDARERTLKFATDYGAPQVHF
jgi:hypothetical protein